MDTMSIAVVAGALGTAAVVAVAGTAVTRSVLARRRERRAKVLRARLGEARVVHARIGRDLEARGRAGRREVYGAPGQKEYEVAHEAMGRELDELERTIAAGTAPSASALAWSEEWMDDVENALGPARFSESRLASFDTLDRIQAAQGEDETVFRMEKEVRALERKWGTGAEGGGARTHEGEGGSEAPAGDSPTETGTRTGTNAGETRGGGSTGDGGSFDRGGNFDNGSGSGSEGSFD